MTVPTDFRFSQESLQAFADCPRRFYLRYVRRLAWPAINSEPALEHERHLEQGKAFHRLVHQHLLGIPEEELSRAVKGEKLGRWWRNYLELGLVGLPSGRYPEVILSTPLSGHRLVAKYDLIAIEAGERAVIVDWKTSHRAANRESFAQRLQTKVYPYVLVQAGSHLNGGPSIRPGQVEMIYWFANFPEDPQPFVYTTAQWEEDAAYLSSLIEEIKGLCEEGFSLTDDMRRCRFCPYRSLCERGVEAGAFEDADGDWDWDLDLGSDLSLEAEQMAENEF